MYLHDESLDPEGWRCIVAALVAVLEA